MGEQKKGINIIRPSEVSLIDRNFVNTNNCSRFNIIDSLYYNYIQLKVIDTTNFFIEGSFSFKTYNLCGDSVIISDGYFKTKFIF